MMTTQPGVYVTTEELLSYEASTRQMALNFSRVTSSLLQGNRPSRLNGRGGAFDQVRLYQHGDDVRDIDWNVTARMRGTPYIRVFKEERERPFLLLIDQTQDMFFGTRLQLKSVLAARIAAQMLWMAHHKKQPYGLVIAGKEQVRAHAPRHHRSHLTVLLNELALCNQQLSAAPAATRASETLMSALLQLRRLVSGNALVTMISDFNQVDDSGWQQITQLALRAQTLALPVYDGIISDWPVQGQLLATWGGLVAEFDFSSRHQRKRVLERAQANIASLRQRLAEAGIAGHAMTTWLPAEGQLSDALTMTGTPP